MRHPVLLALLLSTVPLALVTSGCDFKSDALSSKDYCRDDSDCLGARVCGCGRCRAPEEVEDVCGGPSDTDDSDIASDDVREDLEGDVVSPDVDAAPDVPCPDGANSCGGCQPLEGAPGDPCGDCLGGELVCDGIDTLACEGGDGRNACGGCGELAGVPGQPCGQCDLGEWTCQSGSLSCVGEGLNACGGCASLTGDVGEPCGACLAGTLGCSGDGEALVCSEPDGTNACGGCATLPGALGETCGPCDIGTTVCDGQDAVRCEGATANGCGGCVPLSAQPGDGCGCTSEVLECVGVESLSCEDGFGEPTAPEVLGTLFDYGGWTTTTGTLHKAEDEDWYTIDAVDGASLLRPEATLDASEDYDVCVFFTRTGGGGPDPTCVMGTATTRAGLTGCCSDHLGSSQEAVQLEGVDDPIADDGGVMTILVFTDLSAGSCVPYTLRTKL